MIKKLDIYIFKNNLILFLSANLGILFLFIFVDLFEKYFDENKFKIFGDFQSILLYYLYDSSSILETFFPFSFCLCSVITLSKLQQSSQMVAIHSTGISIFRIISNFFICAVVLSIILFLSKNYITPKFLIKKELIKDKRYFDKSIKYIHFRDKIDFIDGIPNIKYLKNNLYASLNIESVVLSQSKAKKFHATIFNQDGVPILKLFSNTTIWDKNDNITLKTGFFFSYVGTNEHTPFQNLKIKLTTPIYTAYLAQKNPSCLSLKELSKFTDNKEAFSNYWFRYFIPMQPICMLLFSFAFVVPLLYRSPMNAYFLTLSCCMFMFLLYKYLKNEMRGNDLSPLLIGLIIISFSILPLFFNRKSLPT